MITKYNTYIKENVNNMQNIIDILYKVINKLNKDLKQDYFDIKFYNSQKLTILDKYNEDVLQISLYNDVIIIRYRYGLPFIISSEITINIDDPKLDEFFYEKILVANLINLICRNYSQDYIKTRHMFLNINKSLDDMINFLAKTMISKDMFIHILQQHLVPDYIYNEYEYLVNSKNFDLI